MATLPTWAIFFWVLQKLRDLGFAVFSYDYPGYGKSAGSPSERGLYGAADTAYQHLTETLNIAPQHIIAYGHSLGGAIANRPRFSAAARWPCGRGFFRDRFPRRHTLGHLALRQVPQYS